MNKVDATSLARLHTAEAIGVLADVMRNGDKDSARIAAAQAIIDRGHGRAVQAVISVPVRQAVALKLASLNDDELLQIAKGGVGGQNEGPIGTPGTGGSHAPTADGFGQNDLGFGQNDLGFGQNDLGFGQNADRPFRDGDVQDAKFVELDEIDPCS